jgi:hypothetical protein
MIKSKSRRVKIFPTKKGAKSNKIGVLQTIFRRPMNKTTEK